MEGAPKNQKGNLPNIEEILRLLMRELEEIPEPVSESGSRNFLLSSKRYELDQAIREANNHSYFGPALDFLDHRIQELKEMEKRGDFTARNKKRLNELQNAQRALFN
ncbi:hypothetical protein COU49_02455 [Candidatus Nomurabacteria bacterium CG10_big_fil_rev_8_21_14_0_10_35_16]|uniref:Uncharacterized protein n=1 Tax=Candidatus Nomurabacteria bacterium CG10_big_fil_rev_8_21_14_0_10_35_16 TaxID=1974731 RepID=A0A2H0TB15_9BACT|nr:MAG: hypothetical protein COU49_02455 [Candidatus Nomurabacteria bacterium CG10_big_fil_rev_8_21_14_0_10_35_16]